MIFRLATLAALLAAVAGQGTGTGGTRLIFTQQGLQVAVPSNARGNATISLRRDNTQVDVRYTVQDLTGNVTGLFLHGPAGPNEVAPELVNTGQDIQCSLANPCMMIDGVSFNGVVTSNAATGQDYLLESLIYVNITTAANPMGELRGQVSCEIIQQELNTGTEFDCSSFLPGAASSLTTTIALFASAAAAVAAML